MAETRTVRRSVSSAPYAPGYRLFAEFPQQVTFGDPRPRFTSGS